MNKLLMLYKAELRKILSKKSVWVALSIGLIFVLLVGLTNFSSDGMEIYVKYQEETLSAVSGQKMDDDFFENYHNMVKKEIAEHSELYEKIESYDQYAVYMNASDSIGMKALYDLIYGVVRDRTVIPDLSAEDFYESMRYDIEKDGRELGCSQEEISVWLDIFDSIDKPIVYSYALSYQNVLDVLFLISWVLVINISIALSGVFADEKTCKTDAMILSTRNGRNPVCMVKLLAGITVAVSQAFILICVCFGIMFLLYGSAGWNAMIQNVIPSSPWNITIGNMFGIYAGLAVLISIFFAVTNLIISHFTKSSVATMAIHAAIVFSGLFNIPGKLGLISKLWQLRPTMALYYGTFCNTYMYGCFNNVEISFIIYTFLAVLLSAILILSYKKSQIESR